MCKEPTEVERLRSIIREMAPCMMYTCPTKTPPGLPQSCCGETLGECEKCWLWYAGLEKVLLKPTIQKISEV